MKYILLCCSSNEVEGWAGKLFRDEVLRLLLSVASSMLLIFVIQQIICMIVYIKALNTLNPAQVYA